MKRSLTISSALLLACAASAQLDVLDSLPNAVIADLLLGEQLTIDNVVVNCAPSAMGQFIGTSEVPIQHGLVLTTGGADLIAGPAFQFATAYVGMPGDPDLDMELMGMAPTMDACVLEFDCVPTGDTLLFNFAFGSEEYPEFVGSTFNDIFAIYLSGPGFSPAVNVAAIPGGIPVAINNVNADQNSGFFIDNLGMSGQYVTYDGLTQNLTAFAVVVPEEQYHFKMAIADVADGAFDSGVMLEAFSFRSAGGLSTGVRGQGDQPAWTRLRGDVLEFGRMEGLEGSTILILDAMGRTVQRARVTGTFMDLDVSMLGTGTYSARIDAPTGPLVRRFAKH